MLVEGKQISNERLASTVPCRFCDSYAGRQVTFVVDLTALGNEKDITADGLGHWALPECSSKTTSRYYKLVDEKAHLVEKGNPFDYKLHEYCSFLKESHGKLKRQIYRVYDSTGRVQPLAVLMYVWKCKPFPLKILPHANAVKTPTKKTAYHKTKTSVLQNVRLHSQILKPQNVKQKVLEQAGGHLHSSLTDKLRNIKQVYNVRHTMEDETKAAGNSGCRQPMDLEKVMKLVEDQLSFVRTTYNSIETDTGKTDLRVFCASSQMLSDFKRICVNGPDLRRCNIDGTWNLTDGGQVTLVYTRDPIFLNATNKEALVPVCAMVSTLRNKPTYKWMADQLQQFSGVKDQSAFAFVSDDEKALEGGLQESRLFQGRFFLVLSR